MNRRATVVCGEPGCAGSVLADGYCDTCGTKAKAETPPPARPRRAEPLRAGSPAAKPAAAPPAANAGGRCPEAGCAGTILPDGYCDTCGTKFDPAAAAPSPAATRAPAEQPGAAPAPGSEPLARSFVTGSARSPGSRRAISARSTAASRRFAIGAGIVDVPDASPVDPAAVVMPVPEVAEDKRFCPGCGAPVGRSRSEQPGRLQGFCAKCRQPFDFVPKLAAGDLVDGQYRVTGCLAHGGLGWIYLAQDTAVNDRWVVLKGLLNAGDDAAMAVAVAERRFLAEVQHPLIVEIYNFVTHEGAGYLVMEYVGGKSLKQILKDRRAAHDGKNDPLPVAQAIAYILAVLPAFAYLHERRYVYCDFKPDNLIQVGDQVKLIDLGGVRRLDDPSGDIYGTVGFQAPEVAELGPSVSSDLYTIGRTLAVLTLDFRGYQSAFVDSLPDRADHSVLVQYESFHRFLMKSTAPHPDDRFQSVTELSDQLLGVLREVAALDTGVPQPGPSVAFSGRPSDGDLPVLNVDAADPAAGFLTNLPPNDPRSSLDAIADAVTSGQLTDTVEMRLRRTRELIALGQYPAAMREVGGIETADPWEWRAVWLRGVVGLAAGDLKTALSSFDRCMTEVPGELAPKLAAAVAAERAGDHASAALRFGIVSAVDPSYVTAAMGLGRCRLAAGDVAGAIEAYHRIPRTHSQWDEAQIAAARTLMTNHRFVEATAVIDGAQLDALRRATLDLELFEAALRGLAQGTVKPDPGMNLRGSPMVERELRRGLERVYRSLADLTADRGTRNRLIDLANQIRPYTLV